MKKQFVYLLLFSLFFVACDSKSHNAAEVQTQIIEKIPTQKNNTTYSLTTSKNEKITFEMSKQLLSSKQLNGKMVLINFWAPWCKPCIKEMPAFIDLQERYKDDLIIIGVLFDKKMTLEELKTFMKKYKVNFEMTIGAQNDRLAKNLDDVTMIPESFLYDKEGLFLEKFVGEVNKTKLESYLKEK